MIITLGNGADREIGGIEILGPDSLSHWVEIRLTVEVGPEWRLEDAYITADGRVAVMASPIEPLNAASGPGERVER